MDEKKPPVESSAAELGADEVGSKLGVNFDDVEASLEAPPDEESLEDAFLAGAALSEFKEVVAEEITADDPSPPVTGKGLPPGWSKIEGGRADENNPPSPDHAEAPRLPPPPDMEPEPYVEPPLDPFYQQNRSYPPISIPDEIFNTKLNDDMWPSRKGFLRTFVKWMEASTDAPKPFHLAAGLVTLATAIGNRFRVEARRADGLGANFFCLLIGDSGIRKSTTMEPVEELLPKANFLIAGHQKSDLAIITRIKEANNTPQAWLIDEAADLLEMVRGQFGREIQAQLNRLYDNRDLTYSSFTQKATIRAGCYTSLLTASPLPWLRECRLSTEFLQGGVFSRFLVIPAASIKPELAKSNPKKPDPTIREALTVWLDALTKMTGTVVVKLSHKAEQEMQAWMKGKGEVPEVATGVWNRADTILRKIALLYHIAEGKTTEPISDDTMLLAIRFVHFFLLPGHLWATMKLPEIPPFARILQAIEEKVAFSPRGLAYSGMGKEFHAPPRLITEVLWTLWRAEAIRFFWWKPGRGPRRILVGHPDRTPQREGVVLLMSELPPALQRLGIQLGDLESGYKPTTNDDDDGGSSTDAYEERDDGVLPDPADEPCEVDVPDDAVGILLDDEDGSTE